MNRDAVADQTEPVPDSVDLVALRDRARVVQELDTLQSGGSTAHRSAESRIDDSAGYDQGAACRVKSALAHGAT